MRMSRLLLAAALLLAGCADQPSQPAPSAWISALRSGGYVLVFRHAATDWRQGDSDPSNLDACANQRNLDARGRDQAAAIGAGVRALQIPVGKVETSEYCRCIETAKIAFGHGTPHIDLTSVNGTDPAEAMRRVIALRQKIAAAPNPGSNTVLVSHMALIHEATGVSLEEGEAAVFKPLDNGTAQFAGSIAPDDWVRESHAVKANATMR